MTKFSPSAKFGPFFFVLKNLKNRILVQMGLSPKLVNHFGQKISLQMISHSVYSQIDCYFMQVSVIWLFCGHHCMIHGELNGLY